MKHSRGILLAILFASVTLGGCAELNDPYYSPSRPSYGYGGGYDSYDYDRRDRYHERDERRRREVERERDRLDRERDRLEEDRRRLEEERRQREAEERRHREERCPSGFSPSERKCSVEERRRGCRDMRLPGGLGCVSR